MFHNPTLMKISNMLKSVYVVFIQSVSLENSLIPKYCDFVFFRKIEIGKVRISHIDSIGKKLVSIVMFVRK